MADEDAPTAEQCSAGATIEIGGRQGVATWWPTMGGYVGKAAVFADGDCSEVLVWHDGNFPFGGHCPNCSTERGPARVHTCEPEQWIQFGRNLAAAMERLRPADGEQ